MKAPVAPLDGLRILDLSTYVAGPSGSMTLAQMGADVVRVDPIGGASDTNRLPLDSNGHSLYWASLNKQKKTIELDLRSNEGRALLGDLLVASGPEGGILVTNAITHPSLAYDELKKLRTDLIMVHLTGHADGSPAVDYTINTDTGLPIITGHLGSNRPVNHVLPAWDLLAGLQTALAVLAAERVRRETGQGQLVRLSLADVAATTMANLGYVADVTLNGKSRDRDGNYLYGSYGVDFQCSDGQRIMVVALTSRHWASLVALTETNEQITALERLRGLDLSEEADRFIAREEITEIFTPWFHSRSSEDVLAVLSEHRVLWGRYRTVENFVRDPDSILNQSSLFSNVDFPNIGVISTPRSVLKFDEAVSSLPMPAPVGLVGADTDEVLQTWLHLDRDVISALRSNGFIGGQNE